MSIAVQRFIVRAKPMADHPEFHEWQVGRACVFVGEDDRGAAQTEAERVLAGHHLEVLEYENRATLIEERVAAEGGAVLEAYRDAQGGRPFLLFAADEPPIAKKGGIPLALPPPLDEPFVDRVVLRAGGRRLRPEERDYDRSRNADYVINGYVAELKDLQSDPIDVPTRQAKVHGVLQGQPGRANINVLDEVDDPAYVATILKTVKHRIDSAKGQIRSSRARLGSAVRGGGVILLNTGLSSIEPDHIFDFANRLVAQSSSIDWVATMTAIVATNGFDSWIVLPFDPEQGGPHPIEVLRNAYTEEASRLMEEWAASGFAQTDHPAKPIHPRVFSVDGTRYVLKQSLPAGSMRGDA